jgi:class 3 adenylate cyclase/tetratricopeptide (TPR) repeat protein
VLVCTKCGNENSDSAKFCQECAAPLVRAPAAREQRKTVTVLFCDVTGSTALGESTDPEALRALLARYFERMKSILEAHGASVEKFIGDAVMAVFGLPQVHEDDALRACRAALEMREALPELGLQARIGLNTGEVVTGTEERLATGDAVNVAARLEQAARSGEILIGEGTRALVRDAVETEPAELLELRGKAAPVPAHRLRAFNTAPERSHETTFVGRAKELEELGRAWQRACGGRKCELVTIVGEAGVGKSRLTAEARRSIDGRVVSGRCLPYGEGITYWPVVEVVKQLDARPTDVAAAEAIRSLLGESDAGSSAEEIAWAFRKLLEEQAQDRLVVVFDDIHWGEETFLDLVEHVALLSSGAPILLLCMARPELVDRRPSWPVTVRLEPLADADVERLIRGRIGERQRKQVVRACGGNPLFVAEILAIREEPGSELAVPPSLQALLAARLDQLEPSERRVLECAAVEGEVFHRGAVQALASHEEHVTPRLASLVRRELIRPAQSQIPEDDGFRFRHLLIRDAAYAALPKAARAELHESLGSWLEERGADLVELDELLGHHLEQAVRYKAELGQGDTALAERAGERLAAAGRRSLRRGDDRAAASLLGRAVELNRPTRRDVRLELDLASAHVHSDPRKAVHVAEAAEEAARAGGDQANAALARIVAGQSRSYFSSDARVDDVVALGRASLPLLEQAHDHAGLARAWSVLSWAAEFRGRGEEAAQASERALRHSRLAGEQHTHLFNLDRGLVVGPRLADEALDSLDAALPSNPHPSVFLMRAMLLGMLGRFTEASALAREANEALRDRWGYGFEFVLARIAMFEGNLELARDYLRQQCDDLEKRGRSAELSTHAPELGHVLCALGRHEEAEPLAQLGRDLGDEQDFATQMFWRRVRALIEAQRGNHVEGERLAREAVAIGERTDELNSQGGALCDLAEVLAAAGRSDEAAEALEQALARYERKKNLAMVAQVRPQLEELRAGAP